MTKVQYIFKMEEVVADQYVFQWRISSYRERGGEREVGAI